MLCTLHHLHQPSSEVSEHFLEQCPTWLSAAHNMLVQEPFMSYSSPPSPVSQYREAISKTTADFSGDSATTPLLSLGNFSPHQPPHCSSVQHRPHSACQVQLSRNSARSLQGEEATPWGICPARGQTGRKTAVSRSSVAHT